MATDVCDPGDSEYSETEGYVAGGDASRITGDIYSGDPPADDVAGVDRAQEGVEPIAPNDGGSGDPSAPHESLLSGDPPANSEGCESARESTVADDANLGIVTQSCIPLPDIDRRVAILGISRNAPADPHLSGGRSGT